MNQPIRMHNIRKRMGAMTSSTGDGATSQEGNCKVLQNGRQVTLDEQGREVDPIELFARFVNKLFTTMWPNLVFFAVHAASSSF